MTFSNSLLEKCQPYLGRVIAMQNSASDKRWFF